MAKWVDFTEIRARVSLEDVIFVYYGIDNLKRQGHKLVGPCPVHGGDSPRAFHADLEKNVWHCFSQCQRGGNQLDFVAAREQISIRDAALRLQEYFLSSDTESASRPDAERTPRGRRGHHGGRSGASTRRQGPRPAPAHRAETTDDAEANPPLELTLKLDRDHPHLVRDRGLRPETIEHFGVGYCSRGILRGCIAIPIHDEHGVLVAYAGRRLGREAIEEHGKYKLPKGFHKDLVLYNLHRARSAAREHGILLVEGFFSVIKLHEAGFLNVVASMGSELSEAQAALLEGSSDVVVLYDGNKAGRSGAETVRRRLADKLPVRVVQLPDDTEPEDLTPEALRWLLRGMRALDLDEVVFHFRARDPRESGS